MPTAHPLEAIHSAAYKIPTETPESDGTFSWESTTIIVVHSRADGVEGLGYSYSGAAAQLVVSELLAPRLISHDAFDIPGAQSLMQRAVRNVGRSGIAANAIAAVDAALWDLKAKLLDLPLAKLLGMVRAKVPVYGSGGFTNYDDAKLASQLGGWVEHEGCRWVKMKIGRDSERDPQRVRAARRAIGDAGLFVDANGALSRKAALEAAQLYAAEGVTWFEEPVSSDDLEGLRLVRDHTPAEVEVAAGEYAYNLDDVRRMLAAGAVDVQQADATRCFGISGFMSAAALCEAYHTDLSAHCAPSLHCHVACALERVRHIEYFFDHVRIENLLFDGAAQARDGVIRPDLGRPGLGLDLKQRDAQRYLTGRST